MVRRVAGVARIVACTEALRAAGVRTDMTLAHAQALAPPEVVVVDHDPEREAAALRRLAHWATRFTPVVAVDPPDGLLLDTTGCERVHGGERRLVQRVLTGLGRLGFRARVALAATVGCAWGVARLGALAMGPVTGVGGQGVGEAGGGADGRRGGARAGDVGRSGTGRPGGRGGGSAGRSEAGRTGGRGAGDDDDRGIGAPGAWAIVPSGGEREALGPLPIGALRIDAVPGVREALVEVGVTTVADVLRLPRTELFARCGAELLQRIDRAIGRMPETIEAIPTIEPPRTEMTFDGPVRQLEGILEAGRRTIASLAAAMAQREVGAMRIVLTLDRSDAPPVAAAIALSHPARDAGHLRALLLPRLERLDLGYGVERLRLEAPEVRRMPHEQMETDGAGRPVRIDAVERGRIVDELVARLGATRVVTVQSAPTHLPERAFRRTPGAPLPTVLPERIAAAPRPARLLHPPRRVAVVALADDGPPLRLDDETIAHADGPERLGEAWWTHADPPVEGAESVGWRDYWRVATASGRCLWIFRDARDGGWYLGGEW